ncbi:MAG: hypothetical protein ACK502_03945 [Alphaproteobacteria bacterium]
MMNSSKFLAAALLSACISAGSFQTASAQFVELSSEYEQYVKDQNRCYQKRVDAHNACTADKSLTKEQYKQCLKKADDDLAQCLRFARLSYDEAVRSRPRFTRY